MHRGRRHLLTGWAALLWLLCAPVLLAQDTATTTLRSPILTIDSERLLLSSRFGKRMQQEYEAASAVLAAENRRIEAELIAEEKQLTEQRATLAPEAFRALADAFDAKVQRIRREQDAKSRALAQSGDEDQAIFFDAVAPVLEAIMREAGAAVIVEQRSVFLSQNIIDITEEAIAAIDKAIGDGSDLDPPKR